MGLPTNLIPQEVLDHLYVRLKYCQIVENIGGSAQDRSIEASLLRLVDSLPPKGWGSHPQWYQTYVYPAFVGWRAFIAKPIPIELQAPPVSQRNLGGWTMRFRVLGQAWAVDMEQPGKERIPVAGWATWRRNSKKKAKSSQKIWESVAYEPNPTLPFHPDLEAGRIYTELPRNLWETAIGYWSHHPEASIGDAIRFAGASE